MYYIYMIAKPQQSKAKPYAYILGKYGQIQVLE